MAIGKFDKFILDNMREETIQTVLREVRKLLKREYSKKVFGWYRFILMRVDMEDNESLSNFLERVKISANWYCKINGDPHLCYVYDIQWKARYALHPEEPNSFFICLSSVPTHREDYITTEDALELAKRGLYKPLKKNNGRVRYNG